MRTRMAMSMMVRDGDDGNSDEVTLGGGGDERMKMRMRTTVMIIMTQMMRISRMMRVMIIWTMMTNEGLDHALCYHSENILPMTTDTCL